MSRKHYSFSPEKRRVDGITKDGYALYYFTRARVYFGGFVYKKGTSWVAGGFTRSFKTRNEAANFAMDNRSAIKGMSMPRVV